ncbi:MAG TPA: RNA polymerase sigma factor [Polyangiaceae bacterium]|nr:RNA polymerase sigma factor [Polyangiaceae bacterium]
MALREPARRLLTPLPESRRAPISGVAFAVPGVETDAMLVDALRAHDLGAAGRLYDRYALNVRGLVHRMLGADAELDDVVQEVFVAAITSIRKLREPALLKSWLLGITVGKVRANLRSRWRRRWLTFHPAEELPEVPAPSMETQADVAKEVLGILNRLPPEERIALLLHRLEGLSVEEAAKACDMAISTFKRRLARGEAKFILRASYRPALVEWRASRG